jgi:hypothetical protein
MTNADILSLDAKAPLREVVGVIAAFWASAIMGYYYLFPVLGYSLDYNLSPAPIALYFLVWSVISILYFWRLFSSWLTIDSHIWLYAAQSLGFAAIIGVLVQSLSLLPSLHGPLLAPYTDLLFVTPWYFVPKAVEVLMQQILITTLILELYARFHSYKGMLIGYGLCFAGSHILLFTLSGAPVLYASAITVWAAASTWVFPHLILKVRGGFVYTYAIHLTSYIALAMILHAFPPPGYFGV